MSHDLDNPSQPPPPARATPLPKVPRRLDNSEAARQERLAYVQEQTGVELKSLSRTRFSEEQLKANVEAFLGSVEIPVALGGPLLINGEHATGVIHTPLATSEGALVSSVTRGAAALSLSGGVTTRVLGRRMLRAPLFMLASMAEVQRFEALVRESLADIRAVVRRHSRHAELLSVEAHPAGRAVSLVFAYETGEAAGQNMTTTCTWESCLWLVAAANSRLGIDASDFLVEGGLASDKKVSFANLLNGRGMRVQAEAVLSRAAMRRVLKVSADQFERAWTCSASVTLNAGMTGLNTNVANVVAAIFAATGQDLASIHESSLGTLSAQAQADGSLYVAMTLPSLVIGTIGGGTRLPHAREGLEMMGCSGPGSARRLGEIITGFALALDVSTISAIVAGHFALAHERMGRNRPVEPGKA